MLPNLISYEWLSAPDYSELNQQLASLDSIGILKWAYDTFGDELVYSCSFGAEAIVLLDLINTVRKDATILFLDTDLHFQETLDCIERIRAKYPELQINIIKPQLTLQEQEEKYGEALWKTDPNLCCHLRKVEPLSQALSGSRAWLSGLRRDQSKTRAHLEYVNRDDKFRSIKICPLIHWTWEEVWNYIRFHDLTYNVLHDRHYPSIGCAPCTQPVLDNMDQRAGRWAGLTKTECGLHQ